MTTMLLDTLPSADELLARRADVCRRLIPLRAVYGGAGYMAERQFKIEEAKVATAVRAQLKADGEKVTEPMVDALTRQHPQYIAALTADVERRTQWVALEEELNEIEWRLRCRLTDGALLSAEARLSSVGQ
jgi:hypothetical protein